MRLLVALSFLAYPIIPKYRLDPRTDVTDSPREEMLNTIASLDQMLVDPFKQLYKASLLALKEPHLRETAKFGHDLISDLDAAMTKLGLSRSDQRLLLSLAQTSLLAIGRLTRLELKATLDYSSLKGNESDPDEWNRIVEQASKFSIGCAERFSLSDEQKVPESLNEIGIALKVKAHGLHDWLKTIDLYQKVITPNSAELADYNKFLKALNKADVPLGDYRDLLHFFIKVEGTIITLRKTYHNLRISQSNEEINEENIAAVKENAEATFRLLFTHSQRGLFVLDSLCNDKIISNQIREQLKKYYTKLEGKGLNLLDKIFDVFGLGS